eukprot:Transcript_29002.p1 GENE.Transcript_29002~~Transcript_29002.p1  ORF type:complete len:584 (+),score=116.33 Transcript_29002:255-1754(+)
MPAEEVDVGAGWLARQMRDAVPPLLLYDESLRDAASRAAAGVQRLVPLARCAARCGGVGWCEHASRGDGVQCGCFVPGGLASGGGGASCGDSQVWEARAQPKAHWGPECPLACSGHGRCDWQGFCRCDPGYWGLDCGVTWGGRAGRRPVLALTALEQEAMVARQMGGGGGPSNSRPRAGRRYFKPKIYVHPLPALLRFGVDFAANVDAALTSRLLRSAHRAATAEAADYVYIPGPPLVIDGHRLLARLWHVFAAHNGWNRTATGGPAGGQKTQKARFVMALLTERAAMDSFQVSYSDDDREEWPALATAPHVVGLRRMAPACWRVREQHKLSDRTGHPVRLEAAFVAATIAAGDREQTRELLRVALQERRRRQHASLLGGIMPGGFAEKHSATCSLPAELDPASPSRIWLGLQFNGNRKHPVNFRPGKDVVLPQLLLLSGGGSHADQPSCERMNVTSPLSEHFERAELHRHRRHLLWFGGHGGHNDARTRLLRLYAGCG